MSAVLERQGPNRRIDWGMIWPAVAMVAALVTGAGGVFLTFILGGTASPGERIACDRAVEAVMTSRDAIEIERGGVLIRALPCDVGRRLGPNGMFRPRVEASDMPAR